VENFDRFQNWGRWQKLGVHFLFDTYDRIVQFDDTCMVSPLTPNLAELVPEQAIGCFIEGRHRSEAFNSYLENHMRAYRRSTTLPRERFYNNGVAIYSRSHAPLFDLSSIPWPIVAADTIFPTGGYLSHRADTLGFPLFDLGFAFNFAGSKIKKLARPDLANAYIYHLTSALERSERLATAKAIDGHFRSMGAVRN
jgi:hypothetical protein